MVKFQNVLKLMYVYYSYAGLYAHIHVHVHVMLTLKYVSLYGAMQMWTAARFLPLIIGHLISEDNEYWANFLRLLDIMDIIFTPQLCSGGMGFTGGSN